MQKTVGQIENITRLEQLRIALNKTQKEFGEIIGLDRTTISAIESNKRKLTPGNAYLIVSKVVNVNPAWLLKGEGEMFLKPNVGNAGDNILETLGDDIIKDSARVAVEDARREVNERSEDEVVRLRRENERLREQYLKMSEQITRLAELVGVKANV